MMDQPGRCRRTDGKRWRCSKDVIPNEKYCQNHMHRGCRRSRKLVEASITDPNTPPNGHVSHSNNTIFRGAKDPSNRTTKITFKPASKMEGKANGCDYQRLKRETVVAQDKLPSAGGKHPKSSNAKVEEEERLKTEASNTVNLEFSPKSVLGQVNQSNRQSAGDLEPRRCRRTDGKRWRCTEEVIAGDHKYCSKHMYRGAKKRPQQGECNPFALVKRADKLVVGFDTNLSS